MSATVYAVQLVAIVEGAEAATRLAAQFEALDPSVSITRTVTVCDAAAMAALLGPALAAATAGSN